MDEKQEEEKKAVEETAKVETAKPVTIEALQQQLDELARHAKNKEEEAARVAKKLEKYQADEAQREKDKLSEVERLKLEKKEAEDKAAALEAKMQAETIKHSILAEADKAQFGESKKQKFFNANVAYNLLSPEDKAGDVVKALNELAKKYPPLLEPIATGDGVGSPKGNKTKSVSEEKRNYPIPRF